MPANLTPEYLKAEGQFRQAKSPEDKLEALRAMLAAIPKHKGTEKMQADIKKKISQTNKELQKKKGKKTGTSYIIKREGAGQICLVGISNTGKSTLLATLTNANPEISEVPYTTKIPYPGMLLYQNIQIQIIDLPSINPYYRLYWIYEIIKKADIVLLVIDVSRDDIIEQISTIKEDLKKSHIELIPASRTVAPEDLYSKRTILLANKMDLASSKDNLPVLLELYQHEFLIIPVSPLEKKNIDALEFTIFEYLDIVRVYSKPPGKPPDHNQPFIFSKGSTLLDMAEAIHKDVKEKLKYARLWKKTGITGLRIPKEYVLEDEDIIEIHA
ncbi:MAG: hypothetical protein A2Y62_05590 [Candidatus Fischerbacteria bacterium RBG_13_37_8]|uniref:TGS domain-containing protein n=1 Tax=Candidatus Fischerbacteria bacterium RBG_13_37_8 TaxID=1817863 RepID=A0A1F5VXB4_9BACT|nr:MAG: hypothetical protein A2Y62_05590 [Candidatus Fischerbacteria bacterium RBG_13_37_8]